VSLAQEECIPRLAHARAALAGARAKGSVLSDHIYRITEVVGSSSDSVQQAIRNGVERASRTLRMVEWFEVTEIRGRVDAGQVEQFQVSLKVGFRLDD